MSGGARDPLVAGPLLALFVVGVAQARGWAEALTGLAFAGGRCSGRWP
jgi:hypothetical protein